VERNYATLREIEVNFEHEVDSKRSPSSFFPGPNIEAAYNHLRILVRCKKGREAGPMLRLSNPERVIPNKKKFTEKKQENEESEKDYQR